MMKKLVFYPILFVVLVVFSVSVAAQNVKTIRIGKQVWMAQNLDVNVKGSWYYNEDPKFATPYGRLYTWEAAKKACPAGWRLPSDTEWSELADHFGGEDIAAKELKINGSSGFNATLGGFMDGHTYRFIDNYGGYWSSTTYDEQHAWYRYMTNKDNAITKTYFSKSYGFSVRCIKNN
jgi:uncharacterized protein (TIGR02145 family)